LDVALRVTSDPLSMAIEEDVGSATGVAVSSFTTHGCTKTTGLDDTGKAIGDFDGLSWALYCCKRHDAAFCGATECRIWVSLGARSEDCSEADTVVCVVQTCWDPRIQCAWSITVRLVRSDTERGRVERWALEHSLSFDILEVEGRGVQNTWSTVLDVRLKVDDPGVQVSALGCTWKARAGKPRDDGFIVVLSIHHDCGADLLGIADTGNATGLFTRLSKHWEQNCSENRDDRDYNKKLNQCKA